MQLKSYVVHVSPTPKPFEHIMSTRNLSDDRSLFTNDRIAELVDDFMSDGSSCLPLLVALSESKVLDEVLKVGLMQPLAFLIGTAAEPYVESDLVALSEAVFANKALVNRFISCCCRAAVVDLLRFFFTSMIPQIVDSLIAIVTTGSSVFRAEHIDRVSPFVACTNLSVRHRATKLVSLILKRCCYADENALCFVVENLMKNAIPEQKLDVLLDTLNVLHKIRQLQSVFHYIRVSSDAVH
jgi:hypothetical protein